MRSWLCLLKFDVKFLKIIPFSISTRHQTGQLRRGVCGGSCLPGPRPEGRPPGSVRRPCLGDIWQGRRRDSRGHLARKGQRGQARADSHRRREWKGEAYTRKGNNEEELKKNRQTKPVPKQLTMRHLGFDRRQQKSGGGGNAAQSCWTWPVSNYHLFPPLCFHIAPLMHDYLTISVQWDLLTEWKWKYSEWDLAGWFYT